LFHAGAKYAKKNVKGQKKKKFFYFQIDAFVKNRKVPFFVIPAKAGIQSIQLLTRALDSGFHRSDDFLRVHQNSKLFIFKQARVKTLRSLRLRE
jgi:hypothetical protein